MESLFLTAPPGLEPWLAQEARDLGFAGVREAPGGVEAQGGAAEAMRANLHLRGATRVLRRVAVFPAAHPAQLDKRLRRLPWQRWLRPGVPVRVEATTRGSRIYHAGAAADRAAQAAADLAGAPAAADADQADAEGVRVFLRVERNLVTLSLDATGAPLHRRGLKEAVGKAPLRETLAALLLRAAGWDGACVVIDPMCGSGTLALEAAERRAGLAPGRARGFAFERWAGFDAEAWAAMRAAAEGAVPEGPLSLGFDRDAGAVERARANAARAGLDRAALFERLSVSDAAPPPGPPGLVICNPPYGERIGDRKALPALYGAFGEAMRARFSGWRVAMIATDAKLIGATGLPFGPPGPPVLHGPLKIRLWSCALE
ncbi:MAG: class I SAM-dependent RNA methyltransferase [Pseudomonadota bacterium]